MSGCGFLGSYHFGAIKCLVNNGKVCCHLSFNLAVVFAQNDPGVFPDGETQIYMFSLPYNRYFFSQSFQNWNGLVDHRQEVL